MRTRNAILGSALFFLAAPGVMGGAVPWLIGGWRTKAELPVLQAAGIVVILAGIIVLVDSFARFAIKGLGTPAPIAPTEFLVSDGAYRHVRNPMYVSVLAIIVGQAMLFADWNVAIYAGLFWLTVHAFVTAYEEPTLRDSYGGQYEAYRAGVPRWLPRLSPWRSAVEEKQS